MSEEKKFMNIGPQFVLGLDTILNFLKEKPHYKAQFENKSITYKDTLEDTTNGKREIFIIERKINWNE